MEIDMAVKFRTGSSKDWDERRGRRDCWRTENNSESIVSRAESRN